MVVQINDNSFFTYFVPADAANVRECLTNGYRSSQSSLGLESRFTAVAHLMSAICYSFFNSFAYYYQNITTPSEKEWCEDFKNSLSSLAFLVTSLPPLIFAPFSPEKTFSFIVSEQTDDELNAEQKAVMWEMKYNALNAEMLTLLKLLIHSGQNNIETITQLLEINRQLQEEQAKNFVMTIDRHPSAPLTNTIKFKLFLTKNNVMAFFPQTGEVVTNEELLNKGREIIGSIRSKDPRNSLQFTIDEPLSGEDVAHLQELLYQADDNPESAPSSKVLDTIRQTLAANSTGES